MPQIRHRVQAERDGRGHLSGDGGQDAGVAGLLGLEHYSTVFCGSFGADHAP